MSFTQSEADSSEYSSLEETTKETTKEIRITLLASKIYITDDAPTNKPPEEKVGEFLITLPMYEDVGVPLATILKELSTSSRTDFTNYQILYKTGSLTFFMLAGIYPLENSKTYIQQKDLDSPVLIKYRVAGNCNQPSTSKESSKSKVRRGNEKRICEVLDALTKWKALFTYGQVDSKGVQKIYTRQEAADMIHIPKKTLDDYKLQVKTAKDLKFDFHLHYKEKFGVLRQFNKKMRSANTPATDL